MRAMGIKTRCTDVITLTFGLMMVCCHHLLFIFYSTLFWLCFSRWIFVPAASYYLRAKKRSEVSPPYELRRIVWYKKLVMGLPVTVEEPVEEGCVFRIGERDQR